MKSYIAVAAIMAAVASAKPVADGWAPVYETTSEAPVTTTTKAPVYTTTEAPVYTTTEAPVYTTTTTEEEYETCTEEYETTTSEAPVHSIPEYETTSKAPVYTTTKAPVYTTTPQAPVESWEAISSIPYETTTKKPAATTSWAVWSTAAPKPNNTTAPIPKYTGAASQQGVAFGAMALAGVAMLL